MLPGPVVVEEVEALLGYGFSPFDVAAALGVKPDSLGKALARHQRPDLVEAVRNAERADRRRLGEAKGTWHEQR
jgi:hypothetical protein